MVEFYDDWYLNLLNNSNEKELLARSIASLHKDKKHDSFLEIGMGTSPFFANRLSNLFKDYWIVEKNSCKDPLPKNAKYFQEDFESINLEKKFDAILLSHVIYYFSDLDKSIVKAFELLQKNGSAYFVVNGKDADYGPLKEVFSKITNCPLQFTYDILKNSIINQYRFSEHSVETSLFFNSYEELYERIKLFFDLFPNEFKEHRSEIIAWLKKNVKIGKFSMNQKIFIISRK